MGPVSLPKNVGAIRSVNSDGKSGDCRDASGVESAPQVADALQVVPGTVRSWIQSGALKSTRPGNGVQPGRTYRVRRTDLDAFVAASEGRLPPRGGKAGSDQGGTDGHREGPEVT